MCPRPRTHTCTHPTLTHAHTHTPHSHAHTQHPHPAPRPTPHAPRPHVPTPTHTHTHTHTYTHAHAQGQCTHARMYVLMRFQCTRRSRVDGNLVTLHWCEWELGKIVKQRSSPGLVNIKWPDVGRRTSKLSLGEYGGGPEDGPNPCRVFCRKW